MIGLIMAGGSGTRFWPESRQSLPKQFLKLFNNKSMLRLTYERISTFIENKDIYIVTTQSQVPLILEHIPELSITQIIVEPYGMNTAPCIALSAVYLEKLYDKSKSILVLPADHYIPETEAFKTAMLKASDASKNHKLVTFGIVPNYPATGYGYIETDAEYSDGMFHVKQFKEKPDFSTASEFLARKNFYWNSGMFCWTIESIIDSFTKYQPEILQIAHEVINEIDLDKQKCLYKKMSKAPIDIAIMEKANNVIVQTVSFTWSDVGNWFSLSELMPKNEDSNYFKSDNYSENSANNSVFSNKFTALIGVNDVIIVDTKDALLVINKKESEKVKQVVDYLKENQEDLL